MPHPLPDTVEHWPLDRLRPYDRNARTHSDGQVAQIAASIVEFGWTNPVLADGQGNVIAGHGRLAAAKQLGLDTVPVLVLDHLTEAQRRAYVLADNKLALNAGWDEELLAAELHALNGDGFDLGLTGFSDEELADLMAPLDDEPEGDAADGGDDDDDTPEPPRDPVSRPGDLWHFGTHRLLCGDSTNASAVATLMAGENAVLVFTSPPYGQQRDYASGGIADWDRLMEGVFAALPVAADAQVLVNLGLIHREGEWIPYWRGWLDAMREAGWRRFGLYCWDQGPGLPGDWGGRLAPAFELVFHFNKASRQPNKIVACAHAGEKLGGGGLRAADGTVPRKSGQGNAIQDHRIPDNVLRVTRHKGAIEGDGSHPAVFPVALPEFVINTYTDAGEILFEPFSGSGSTIIAGQRTGRLVRAMELAPAYVDVAILRWQALFPEIPVILADGRPFAAVVAERGLPHAG
jgi:DNA modification methylase